jgi:predicted membrane protein
MKSKALIIGLSIKVSHIFMRYLLFLGREKASREARFVIQDKDQTIAFHGADQQSAFRSDWIAQQSAIDCIDAWP